MRYLALSLSLRSLLLWVTHGLTPLVSHLHRCRYLHQIIQAQAARTVDLENTLSSVLQVQQSPPSSLSQLSGTDESSDSPVVPPSMASSSGRHGSYIKSRGTRMGSSEVFEHLHEAGGMDDGDDIKLDGERAYDADNAGSADVYPHHHPFDHHLPSRIHSTFPSGLSSPNIFPWSTQIGSPNINLSAGADQHRPDTGVSRSTMSSVSRRDSGEEEEEEDEGGRGREREVRYLSGGGWGMAGDVLME